MTRMSNWVIIIMIHSGCTVFCLSAVNFNKEIEMVMKDQYSEHLVTLEQTQVTEAAVDFENRFRKPTTNKRVTFFPIQIKPKPFTKSKTKVAKLEAPPKPPPLDLAQLYKQKTL